MKRPNTFPSILFILLLLAVSAKKSLGQGKDTTLQGIQIVMDEVVVKAAKNGWNIGLFIQKMKEDTTFYKAFLGLRIVNYTSDNEIHFFNEKKEVIASLENRTEQSMLGDCRTVKISREQVTGKYYHKKKQPNFYTAELFQNLFFKERTNECGQNNNIPKSSSGKGKIEQHKEQLKQLVFNPGSKVDGIPFIGKKASIFEHEGTTQRYNFSLSYEWYLGEECYVFRARPKTEYSDEVVYNQLDTWFRVKDYAILARDYSLSYRTLFYDFEVMMKVRLEKNYDLLLPSIIDYEGNWHIFTKKRERSKFKILFDY